MSIAVCVTSVYRVYLKVDVSWKLLRVNVNASYTTIAQFDSSKPSMMGERFFEPGQRREGLCTVPDSLAF
jgi:hypothetical protein